MTTFAKMELTAANDNGQNFIQEIKNRWNNGEAFTRIVGTDPYSIYSDIKDSKTDLFQIDFGKTWVSIDFQSGFDCFDDEDLDQLKSLLSDLQDKQLTVEYAEFANEYCDPYNDMGVRLETNSEGELVETEFHLDPYFFYGWSQFSHLDF